MLAGGAASAAAAQQLTTDLDARNASNQLTPADAADFRHVDQHALLANSLLVAGGVLSAAGIGLWASAPDASGDRGTFRVAPSGRF